MVLPHEGRVIVVGRIGTDLRADEFRLDEMPRHRLQRLAVLLVHGEEEQREHEDDHPHDGEAGVAGAFHQEERRDADERRRAEADELPLRQPKEHLGLYPRQVAGDGNIRCHDDLLSRSMGVQYASGKAPGLEQGEHQQDRVPHHAPEGADYIRSERDGLYQHSVDADTDDDEEALETQGEQRTEVVLPGLALFPVAEGGQRDGREARHQIHLYHTAVDDDEDHDGEYPEGELYHEAHQVDAQKRTHAVGLQRGLHRGDGPIADRCGRADDAPAPGDHVLADIKDRHHDIEAVGDERDGHEGLEYPLEDDPGLEIC